VTLSGCSSLYKLNHLAANDQSDKEWTAVVSAAPGTNAEPAKATTPPTPPRCKEGASAEQSAECDRLKRNSDTSQR